MRYHPDYRIDELDKESVSPRPTVTAHPKMDTFVGGRGVGDDWWGPVGLAPAPVCIATRRVNSHIHAPPSVVG